jgi:hypothetical protein
MRSCDDLAQPGKGLVKDRDACAATVMASWRRGPVSWRGLQNFGGGGVTLVPFA